MRNVRRTLPIVLPALAILGVLAVAGQAGKPRPLPKSVKLTGGIEIQAADNTGDPTRARVKFIDSSLQISYPDATYTSLHEFISNPDYTPGMPSDTPSLWAIGAGANTMLQYFYCAHVDHEGKGLTDTRCEDPDHQDHYYCLIIGRGKVQKSGAIVFPTGSNWKINKKTPSPGFTVGESTLSAPVTFQVIR